MSCNCQSTSGVVTCSENPCLVTPANTIVCETLPSQITNFTNHFFGAFTKTEVNNVVTWVLPCGLDVGLPGNPRFANEGLACYFLRLFDEGIQGLQGPQGEPGAAGLAGLNAFTIVRSNFVPPAVAGGNVNFLTVAHPSITVGATIFVAKSGWYQVNLVDTTSGLVNGTLLEAIAAPSPVVTTGSMVLVTGPRGPRGFDGIQGPVGPIGPQGPAGTAGSSATTTNGRVVPPSGLFAVPIDYTQVSFSGTDMTILLEQAGTYFVTAQVVLNRRAADAGQQDLYVKLVDTIEAVTNDIPGSSFRYRTDEQGAYTSLTVTAIVTVTGAAHSVSLFAVSSTATAYNLESTGTTLIFIKLS